MPLRMSRVLVFLLTALLVAVSGWPITHAPDRAGLRHGCQIAVASDAPPAAVLDFSRRHRRAADSQAGPIVSPAPSVLLPARAMAAERPRPTYPPSAPFAGSTHLQI